MPGFAAGKAPEAPALVMRLSVPAAGGLRTVATELATKVAEYLGAKSADLDAVRERLDALVTSVSDGRNAGEVALEFREVGRELVIQARCGDRSSEVRHPLPA